MSLLLILANFKGVASKQQFLCSPFNKTILLYIFHLNSFRPKVTTFFPKAYYLFSKSILPFLKEVGILNNLTVIKQCPNSIQMPFRPCSTMEIVIILSSCFFLQIMRGYPKRDIIISHRLSDRYNPHLHEYVPNLPIYRTVPL